MSTIRRTPGRGTLLCAVALSSISSSTFAQCPPPGPVALRVAKGNDINAYTADHCVDGAFARDAVVPVIVLGPEPVSACPGENVSLECRVTGATPSQIQWKKNGIVFATGTSIATLNAVTTGDDGAQIVCSVTDASTTIESPPARLTVFGSSVPAAAAPPGSKRRTAPRSLRTARIPRAVPRPRTRDRSTCTPASTTTRRPTSRSKDADSTWSGAASTARGSSDRR